MLGATNAVQTRRRALDPRTPRVCQYVAGLMPPVFDPLQLLLQVVRAVGLRGAVEQRLRQCVSTPVR